MGELYYFGYGYLGMQLAVERVSWVSSLGHALKWPPSNMWENGAR